MTARRYAILHDDEPARPRSPEHSLLAEILARAILDHFNTGQIERKDMRSARRFFGRSSVYETLEAIEDHSDPGEYGTLAHICSELGHSLSVPPLVLMRRVLACVFDSQSFDIAELLDRLRS